MTAWERDLAQALAAHELVAAGHKLVADPHAIDRAQRAVVAVIDRAIDDGVPEADIDVALSRHADEATTPKRVTARVAPGRSSPSPGGP